MFICIINIVYALEKCKWSIEHAYSPFHFWFLKLRIWSTSTHSHQNPLIYVIDNWHNTGDFLENIEFFIDTLRFPVLFRGVYRMLALFIIRRYWAQHFSFGRFGADVMDTVAIWTKKLCVSFIQGGLSSANDNIKFEVDDKHLFDYPVLDLGTGNGLLLQALAKQGYRQWVILNMFSCLYSLHIVRVYWINYANSIIWYLRNDVIMLHSLLIQLFSFNYVQSNGMFFNVFLTF